MKVVVFGGSGFLGSHVCDQLTAAGHQVVIFDSAASAWRGPEQTMVVGDILDAAAVDAALEGAAYVYNFAGIADIDEAMTKPVETVLANVLGNVRILEACRKNKVQRYLYASSAYVFSRQGGFYRCSKQAAENYIEEYQRTYGLDFTILRYGSLYGPRSDPRNGLYRIVRGALETGKIRYEGSPEAMREYVHVQDAARASVTALGDDFRNRHVILTGQEPMRVVDLLHMLGEILGKPDAVDFVESTHAGHYVRTPYSYRPSAGLRYLPPLHVHLAQGLLQLVEHIAAELETPHG